MHYILRHIFLCVFEIIPRGVGCNYSYPVDLADSLIEYCPVSLYAFLCMLSFGSHRSQCAKLG